MSSLNESVEGNAALQNAICNRLDQNISSYVDRFRGFTKKSAENTIEMARCFFEAKQELDDKGFGDFCNKIGVPKKGSTSRKYEAIGEHASILTRHIELLPSDWTTIYFLATLVKKRAEILDEILSSEDYKLGLSLGDIKKIAENCGYVPKKNVIKSSDADLGPAKKEAKAKMALSIILDGLVEDEARALYAETISLKEKYGFTMVPTKECKKLGRNTVH